MPKQLTVLVVDDSRQARLLVSCFIDKLGHIPLLAQSGEEAVALFTAHAPDLVLLDVHMPGMSGYETTRRIRELAGARWVPIIFLSAAADEEDKIKGLEVGGDDYLTKPVHFRMLEAKMKVMQRIAKMQRQLRDDAEQLERYREENEREQRLAKHLLDQIVRADVFEEDGVERWTVPAQHFSGDLLMVARAPGGALHVMLADGTGHGLAAALSVLPVADVFYSMTERGFVIASIARELNRKMKRLLPTGRFVAATLASVTRKERTIEIWNGGNPAALFVRHDGRILRSWPSMHPALGIFRSEEFSDRTEVFHWIEGGQLFMCSDGLLEAENIEGKAFGEERMRRVLARASLESRFGRLRTALNAHLDGRPAHDDLSLIAIDCLSVRSLNMSKTGRTKREENSAVRLSTRWRFGVRLGATELKTMDVLPFLMEWVEQINVDKDHRGRIFLILAELFNNALDHGILGLDSGVKADPEDGFERYLAERAMRLEALASGFVEIEIEPLRQPAGELLQFRVKDSGGGFDYDAMLGTTIEDSSKRSGRGIALVRDLCAKVTYLGNGNEVLAHYRLS
jgi:CheY-like chemotaxis protein/anti-sigma regulatory factor (Ser/Thr protein kinase)